MVIYITVIYAVIYGCAIYAGTMGSCFIGVLRSRAAWGVFTIIPHPPLSCQVPTQNVHIISPRSRIVLLRYSILSFYRIHDIDIGV